MPSISLPLPLSPPFVSHNFFFTQTLPVTPRTLETMIRLATAHARCNLRTEVKVQDAEVALELMQYALYHDTKGPKATPGKLHLFYPFPCLASPIRVLISRSLL